jgi:hypothetical protein
VSRALRAAVTLEIECNVTEVFAVLCDARAWPVWAHWTRQVIVEPPGPIRVGSELRIARRGLDLHRRLRTVTDMRPDRLIAIEDESGNVRLWFHLDPSGDSSRVTVRIELRPAGLIPFVRRHREQGRMRSELRRLKALIESSTGTRATSGFRATAGASRSGARRPH